LTSQLRELALAKQGLLSSQQFGKGLAGTLNAIEHLGYVQVDTLSVVERAHHHVLWNRVPEYDPGHLNQLISKQKIFEYWYHAASYLPISDYRYALVQMTSIRNGESRYYTKVDEHLMKEILARVKSEGKLRLRDLDLDKGNKGKGKWWSWGPVKRAVEKLFMQGDLMICERIGMEKTYDLAERCLPEGIDMSTPTVKEYAAFLYDTTLRTHGVFTLKQLLHLKTGKPLRDAMHEVLDERVDAGLITALNTDKSSTLYADINALEQAETANSSTVKVLSPFDNVLIHRDRLSTLFDFDYRIECYVPKAKRQFGYFCLPILFADTFVARIDCKAHRAEQRLEVISLHLQDISLDRELFFPALTAELQRFADFNKCSNLDTSAIAGLRSP